MADADAARIRAAVAGKSPEYFSAHGLGDALEEAGMARTPEAIRAAVGLLATDDDVYSSIWAVSRGLREGLADGDEYACLVSRVAGLVRFDLALGPVSDSLVAAGRDSPAAAASAAARLVGLGDADHAAFLAGGAWAGAAERCASLAYSLLSSGDPARAAAGIRTLRVARGEHRMPDGKEVARAVAAALRSGAASGPGPGGDAHREAMEALLDLYPEDPAGIGPMIEDLALRRSATRPPLADRIAGGPAFDGATALRYMDICIDGAGPDDVSLHCVCSALAVLAASEPAGVARRMAALAIAGSYRDTFGGRVMEELGREGAAAAAKELLVALRWPRGGEIRRYLPSMVRHLARHAGASGAAAPLPGRPGQGSAAPGDSLAALEALAEGGRVQAGKRRAAEPQLAALKELAKGTLLADRGGELEDALRGRLPLVTPEQLGAASAGELEGALPGWLSLRVPDMRPETGGAAEDDREKWAGLSRQLRHLQDAIEGDLAVITPGAAPQGVACALVARSGSGPPDRLVLVRSGSQS